MAALILLLPTAQATSATAELDFKFELIDLDPSDGVTPAMTVGWMRTGGWVTGYPPIEVSTDGTSNTHYQRPGVEALATWNYDKGHFLSTASTTDPSSGRIESEVMFNAENWGTPSTGNCCLTVSPGTALKITGVAKVNVSGGAGLARAGFIIYDMDTRYAYKEAGVSLDGSQEIDLSTTWVNDGRSNVSFALWTFTSALPSPVPEPSALVLMAAGSAALAWRLRGRRRAVQRSEA